MTSDTTVPVTLKYFAALRTARGQAMEQIRIHPSTAQELYCKLRAQYHWALDPGEVRVAINGQFAPMDQAISSGDTIAFIPPVSGG